MVTVRTQLEQAIWYRELGATAGGLRLAEAWEGPGHPEGAYVDDVPRGAELVWRTAASADGLLHVGIPFERAPDAPSLWFVAADGPRRRPPSCVLTAYAGDALPDGTVVEAHALARPNLDADAGLGHVRWFRDGLVQLVHVAPEFRRRDIGTSLLCAAGAWQQANRWPGYLHVGPGRHAALARRVVGAFRLPGRIPGAVADGRAG